MSIEQRPRYWLLAVAILTFLSLMIGYGMRFNPDGQGCPDFPTCFGQWTIPAESAARLEIAHRLIAAISGLITLSLTGWMWLKRQGGGLKFSLTITSVLFLVQAGLGAGLAGGVGAVWLSTAHLAAALSSMALLSGAVTQSFLSGPFPQQNSPFFRSSLRRFSTATLLLVFGLMISGVLVARLDAGSACAGFPLCNGELPSTTLGWLAMGHRLLTLLAGLAVMGTFFRVNRSYFDQPLVLSSASALMVLFVGQAFIGAMKVQQNFPPDLVVVHAAITAAVWVAAVILFVAALRLGKSEADERLAALTMRVGGKQRLKAYLMLNKPIIVALLLVTTYAGMVVGGKSIPSVELTLWTLLGGALAAGGSSAINQYIDRQIDGAMQRTAKRPIPSGVLTPAEGLAYGLSACLAAFFILAGTVNLLAALLSVAGMIYYVLIYSIWLKHLTVQNIVIGGGAGAIPPLVGWAAATGSLNIPSLFLFALVFMWTPPHFWALALVRAKDYARAGVPMLPVVRGEKETRNQIFIYTLELVALTLLMPVFKVGGSIFLISAVVLGLWLIHTAWNVLRKPGNKVAWRMYRYSSMYLAFIFLALVVDVLL
ncbi:protoheme IX farnesyltransferase [Bellilinea caldifistulae]|nr:heme o synthase [Bellilinea caldifistulae]GAP10107.1 protoheme IX farnesyltransferase [Bellilinea caldifistulae]